MLSLALSLSRALALCLPLPDSPSVCLCSSLSVFQDRSAPTAFPLAEPPAPSATTAITAPLRARRATTARRPPGLQPTGLLPPSRSLSLSLSVSPPLCPSHTQHLVSGKEIPNAYLCSHGSWEPTNGRGLDCQPDNGWCDGVSPPGRGVQIGDPDCPRNYGHACRCGTPCSSQPPSPHTHR